MSKIYEDLLNRHRWVCIKGDYSCDGVWDIEGSHCGAEELPISPALVELVGPHRVIQFEC